MKFKYVNVRITEAQHKKLQALAAVAGVLKGQWARMMLGAAIDDAADKAKKASAK